MDLGAYVPSFDNADGGGLVSTRADLDRFVRDLLEGRVLAPAAVAVMLDTVPDGQGGAYGLGIGTRHLAGHRVWMHTGASGVAAAYVPDLQLSLAVATGQALVAPDGLLAATIQNVEDLARAHLLVPGRLIELADQPLGQTAGSSAGPCGTN